MPDMLDYVFRKLGEWFDPPCSYTIDGEDVSGTMLRHGYCGNDCGDDYGKCWKSYFDIKIKEDTNDS